MASQYGHNTSSTLFFASNLIGNRFLQKGHRQNITDIITKIVNEIAPIIANISLLKRVPIIELNIEIYKNIKEILLNSNTYLYLLIILTAILYNFTVS